MAVIGRNIIALIVLSVRTLADGEIMLIGELYVSSAYYNKFMTFIDTPGGRGGYDYNDIEWLNVTTEITEEDELMVEYEIWDKNDEILVKDMVPFCNSDHTTEAGYIALLMKLTLALQQRDCPIPKQTMRRPRDEIIEPMMLNYDVEDGKMRLVLTTRRNKIEDKVALFALKLTTDS